MLQFHIWHPLRYLGNANKLSIVPICSLFISFNLFMPFVCWGITVWLSWLTLFKYYTCWVLEPLLLFVTLLFRYNHWIVILINIINLQFHLLFSLNFERERCFTIKSISFIRLTHIPTRSVLIDGKNYMKLHNISKILSCSKQPTILNCKENTKSTYVSHDR